MDSNSPLNSSSTENLNNNDLPAELKHVTEEMYKKNAELALINRTLSILQKINTIILSNVTDIQQVSQQLVDVIASEAEIKSVSIYLAEKDKGLLKLASSEGESIQRAEYLVKKKFPGSSISFNSESNLLIKALKLRTIQTSGNYMDILLPDFTSEESSLIQETLNVKGIFVYPLIVRNEIIGAIYFSTISTINNINQHEQDLMNRLVDIIGIALDNSILYKSIQEANEKLQQLDRLKDEFVSLASHELRTPMTAIKSYVWLLLFGNIGQLSEKQKTYLQRTYISTERLIKLVNDMLNISRIESGRFEVEIAQTDINKLIEEVIFEVQARANEVGVNIVYDKSDKQLNAAADGSRTKEVVINLIGNSIKFTPAGGSINISAIEKEGFIEISVRDTGSGIASDDIPKLFKKFNMVGGSFKKEKGQGTGLGLYLSKSLVELQKGKIWVSSEGEGKGAVFTFTLPVWKVTLEEKKERDSLPAPGLQA